MIFEGFVEFHKAFGGLLSELIESVPFVTSYRCSDMLLSKSANSRYVYHMSSGRAQPDFVWPAVQKMDPSYRAIRSFTAEPRQKEVSKYRRKV